MSNQSLTEYRFSFGPWNIHEGADPFGPPVRDSFTFDEKVKFYRALGFVGIQFHDDDIVPDINDKTHAQLIQRTKVVKQLISEHGLMAEIVAPRLWEDPRTIDGAYTSNNPSEREYAIERSKRCIDIANEIGCRNIVLWLAREGTYIREAKNSARAVGYLLDAINTMLDYDPQIRILIEPKPMVARLTYVFQPRGTTAAGALRESEYEFFIFGGVRPENRVGHDVRWRIPLDVLPALRDAEGDLANWRRSPLRPRPRR